MRTRRHSEDVASESYTARVDDANGTITREKKHLTQICVHKIGGSTADIRKGLPCWVVTTFLYIVYFFFDPESIPAKTRKLFRFKAN